jgi:ribosomal protein L24E
VRKVKKARTRKIKWTKQKNTGKGGGMEEEKGKLEAMTDNAEFLAQSAKEERE